MANHASPRILGRRKKRRHIGMATTPSPPNVGDPPSPQEISTGDSNPSSGIGGGGRGGINISVGGGLDDSNSFHPFDFRHSPGLGRDFVVTEDHTPPTHVEAEHRGTTYHRRRTARGDSVHHRYTRFGGLEHEFPAQDDDDEGSSRNIRSSTSWEDQQHPLERSRSRTPFDRLEHRPVNLPQRRDACNTVPIRANTTSPFVYGSDTTDTPTRPEPKSTLGSHINEPGFKSPSRSHHPRRQHDDSLFRSFEPPIHETYPPALDPPQSVAPYSAQSFESHPSSTSSGEQRPTSTGRAGFHHHSQQQYYPTPHISRSSSQGLTPPRSVLPPRGSSYYASIPPPPPTSSSSSSFAPPPPYPPYHPPLPPPPPTTSYYPGTPTGRHHHHHHYDFSLHPSNTPPGSSAQHHHHYLPPYYPPPHPHYHHHPFPPPPIEYIQSPHQNDVLCGRGGATNSHSGNRSFRRLVKRHQDRYLRAKKKEKPAVAAHIVSLVRNLDPPGRFLKRDKASGWWIDIGDDRAKEKTSQALREGAPELRRKRELGETSEGGGDDDDDDDDDDFRPRQENLDKGEVGLSKGGKASKEDDEIQDSEDTTSKGTAEKDTFHETASSSTPGSMFEGTKPEVIHLDDDDPKIKDDASNDKPPYASEMSSDSATATLTTSPTRTSTEETILDFKNDVNENRPPLTKEESVDDSSSSSFSTKRKGLKEQQGDNDRFKTSIKPQNRHIRNEEDGDSGERTKSTSSPTTISHPDTDSDAASNPQTRKRSLSTPTMLEGASMGTTPSTHTTAATPTPADDDDDTNESARIKQTGVGTSTHTYVDTQSSRSPIRTPSPPSRARTTTTTSTPPPTQKTEQADFTNDSQKSPVHPLPVLTKRRLAVVRLEELNPEDRIVYLRDFNPPRPSPPPPPFDPVRDSSSSYSPAATMERMMMMGRRRRRRNVVEPMDDDGLMRGGGGVPMPMMRSRHHSNQSRHREVTNHRSSENDDDGGSGGSDGDGDGDGDGDSRRKKVIRSARV